MSDQINFFGGQKLDYEKRQQMKLAINAVFKSNNPFGEMFQDWVKQKMLLSLHRYYLDKKQFVALLKIMKILGETSFYVSHVEGSSFADGHDVEHPASPHWEFASDISYEEYKNKMSPMDYALYSINGTWGIFVFHEDYAVVGGTDAFMALFKQFYPYAEYNLKKFMQQGFDSSIVQKLLTYVNAPIQQYNHRIDLTLEQSKHMKQAFMHVFKNTNISYIDEGVFSNAIQEKMLLYCTDAFYLNKTQFTMLLRIIKILGESSFYVSRIDERGTSRLFGSDNKQDDHFELNSDSPYEGYLKKVVFFSLFGADDKQDDHFELSCDISYEEYLKKAIFLEYALYSTQGTWGVLISQESVALIGASHEFIELFKKNYTQWEEDIKKFIAECKYNKEHYNSDISWLLELLQYIGYSSKNNRITMDSESQPTF